MLAAGATTWASVGDTSRIGRGAQNSNTNWQSILGGSNDDAQVGLTGKPSERMSLTVSHAAVDYLSSMEDCRLQGRAFPVDRCIHGNLIHAL